MAYAANIGGTGFITGSPPNLLVLTLLDGSNVTFLSWFLFCFPLVLVNLSFAFGWLFLVRKYLARRDSFKAFMSPDPAKIQIKENLKKLSDSEDKNGEIGENIALQVQALSQTSVNTCVTTINDSTVVSNPDLSEVPNIGKYVITVWKNAKFTVIEKNIS